MQIGAGYDFKLTSSKHKTQTILSPFISFQPYYGQDPRSIETWNLTTVRIGAAIKIGNGRRIIYQDKDLTIPIAPKMVKKAPELAFWVFVPTHTVAPSTEVFPLRNYVFFERESTKIPDRYVRLSPENAKNFSEEKLPIFGDKNIGRSEQQLRVYYNVLNILGSRMMTHSNTQIRLIGSSENGGQDGLAMSEEIKKYLVTSFQISPSRIQTTGQDKPNIPSIQQGATKELVLLREGDRRVSIETQSPELLMEFEIGNNTYAPDMQSKSPATERMLTLNIDGANNNLSFWTLEVTDQLGKTQNFGPFQEEKITLAESAILGNNKEGSYKLTMVAKTKDGEVIRKDAALDLKLWVEPKAKEILRFSVIYEFNKSQVIEIYHKYLNEVVTPKIPNNATVIIHGHTDIIGGEAYNQKLSADRANNIKTLLSSSLKKAGKSNVKFETTGYGENETSAPFANKYPEERFYNRTVIIDIEPQQ